jgi:colanic acid/amylovoran biosynthesis glycosyltransferase
MGRRISEQIRNLAIGCELGSGMRKGRIAYLTSEYPAGSHTFIRREIIELERQGLSVDRFSIRSKRESITDPKDLREDKITHHILEQGFVKLLLQTLVFLVLHPIIWWKGVCEAFQYGRVSNRGLLRHFVYFVEAVDLYQQLQSRKIDHVHCHLAANATTVAAIVARMGGASFSFTAHGPGDFDNPVGLGLGRKVHDARFVVAISDFCRSQIYRWADLEDWPKIHLVRCTVTNDFFDNASTISPQARGLVCVGRLSPQKGQLLLIEEMAKLVKEGVDCHLTLAGDGELRQKIEQRIGVLGLSSHVTITGWINEEQVRQYLQASRGLVLPSFGEGLPVVIMEALAMGRPVISTNIAAISELVRSNETGWLISPGNGDELNRALKSITESDSGELDRMGSQGRSLVMERHSVKGEVAKLIKLFRSI